jgi:hypothetical protein
MDFREGLTEWEAGKFCPRAVELFAGSQRKSRTKLGPASAKQQLGGADHP